jgi:cyanate lyase
MIDSKIEVPSQLRELTVLGINNAENALALFFEDVSKSLGQNSAESIALIKRVIAIKMDYARKIARTTDLKEASALQFAYCRSQVAITTDLIRIVSESGAR